MSFAEIILVIAFGILLCTLMSPLQKRLERKLYELFRSGSRKSTKRVIDITDYSSRKDKPPS